VRSFRDNPYLLSAIISFSAISARRLLTAFAIVPVKCYMQSIDIWPDNWAASPRIAGARFSLSPNSSKWDRPRNRAADPNVHTVSEKEIT